MKLNRKQLRALINEAMKFHHDGRSMDQVSRDIKSAMSAQPARHAPKIQGWAPADQPQLEPISSLQQPEDLSPFTELQYYNDAQDKDIFMAGYNAGADDGAFDAPMKYGSADSADDPSTSLDDYAIGYQLGYIAFS